MTFLMQAWGQLREFSIMISRKEKIECWDTHTGHEEDGCSNTVPEELGSPCCCSTYVDTVSSGEEVG